MWTSVACVAILVCWLGSSELLLRLAPAGFTAESTIGRAAIYRDSLRMLPGHWLLGRGAGTFSEVFPHFRSFHSDLLVNEVHNDYLQTLIETGIVGFAALLSFVAMLYRRAMRSVVRETSDRNRSLRMAALTGCTGLLIHGLWDFNLQIPANAAWFFVLAALASGPVQRSRGLKSRHALDKEEANIPAYRR
jgi:O-antigen ligase